VPFKELKRQMQEADAGGGGPEAGLDPKAKANMSIRCAAAGRRASGKGLGGARWTLKFRARKGLG
jgi:hypothetical protein